MAAYLAEAAAEAAKYPPVRMELPYEPHRRTVEILGAKIMLGGPEMGSAGGVTHLARDGRFALRGGGDGSEAIRFGGSRANGDNTRHGSWFLACLWKRAESAGGDGSHRRVATRDALSNSEARD
jgi:hypothetical protein